MWEHAAALAWWARAQAGDIWTPYCVDRDAGNALLWAVRYCNDKYWPEMDNGTLRIDTCDGGSMVWAVAAEVERGVWNCHVDRHALSAGLILVCACKGRRTCVPHAKFLFHSLDQRFCDSEDTRRAKWFADRTAQPTAFWFEHAQSGEDLAFGAEEAVKWGVVHEVVDA